jgi:hypothetical protein
MEVEGQSEGKRLVDITGTERNGHSVNAVKVITESSSSGASPQHEQTRIEDYVLTGQTDLP